MGVGAQLKKNEQPIKKWPFVIIIIFTIVACGIYVNYINVARTTVPIMDYWRHIAQYGQIIIDGELQIGDLFGKSFAGHTSPLNLYLTFVELGSNNFDMIPLIEKGTILRVLLACALLILFQKKFYQRYSDKQLQLIVLSAALIMAALNYNQWEVATQQFSQGFMRRLCVYFLLFLAGDGFIRVIEKCDRRWHFIYAIIYGLLVAFDGLMMSSGYILGFMGAIGLACICVFLKRRKDWKQYFFPFGVLAVLMIAGMVGYLNMLQSGSSSGTSVLGKLPDLWSAIRGIVLYYGGIFVPNTFVDSNGAALAYLVGIFVICTTIVEVVIYVKNDRQGKQIFPLMCVFYAFVIAITVTLTRVATYGVETTMSSRYVAESTVGLVGLIWVMAENRAEDHSKRNRNIQLIVIGAMILMLGFNMKTELDIAPNRGEYSRELENLMLTIDTRTDEELGIMQADPKYVRQAVMFLRENRLSIFEEDSEKWDDKKEGRVQLRRGVYDDGWVGSVLEFDVYTEEPSIFTFDGYFHGTLAGFEEMEIYVNNEFVGTYSIVNNSFAVEIPLDECGEVLLSIHNNFAIKAVPPDVRTDLAYILSGYRLSVVEGEVSQEAEEVAQK